MSEMIDFLSLPDVDSIEEEIFVNNRIGRLTIKPMTVDQHSEYIRRSKSRINKKGMDFDAGKFNLLVVSNHIVKPNFSDAELLKKAGCMTAEDLIKRKLLSGEISEIAARICSLSGFDEDINESIEEAKN